MKLEVGPGYTLTSIRGYKFIPHYSPMEEDVMYLDVKPPNFKCGCSWIVANAEYIPLKDECVEEVYASHVIEHIYNPSKFLAEAYRILKRGEKVIIVTPNFLSRNAWLDPDHKHIFNFLSLRRLFKENGLKPYFPVRIGSLIPKPLRYLLKALFLLFSDEIVIIGKKI